MNVDLYSASSWSTTSNALPLPISWRWSPQANPTARHQQTLRNHVIRVGAPRDMPVYFPAFAGTKLYCLVTEATTNVHNGSSISQSRAPTDGSPAVRCTEDVLVVDWVLWLVRWQCACWLVIIHRLLRQCCWQQISKKHKNRYNPLSS